MSDTVISFDKENAILPLKVFFNEESDLGFLVDLKIKPLGVPHNDERPRE